MSLGPRAGFELGVFRESRRSVHHCGLMPNGLAFDLVSGFKYGDSELLLTRSSQPSWHGLEHTLNPYM